MEEKFDTLVAELTKRKVPCKVKLVKFAGETELVIEVGMDCPDDITDNAFEAISAAGLNNQIGTCAEQSGGDVLRSERVCGGAKNYFNGIIWRG
jgi:hypothetical protein